MKKYLMVLFMLLASVVSGHAQFATLNSATIGNGTESITFHAASGCKKNPSSDVAQPVAFSYTMGNYRALHKPDALHYNITATVQILYTDNTVDTLSHTEERRSKPGTYVLQLGSICQSLKTVSQYQFSIRLRLPEDGYTEHGADDTFSACARPMPTGITAFDVTTGGAYWATAKETRVVGYQLQYCADGKTFKTIHMSPARGPGHYHCAFPPATGYYRLVGMNLDASTFKTPPTYYTAIEPVLIRSVSDKTGRQVPAGTERTPGQWVVRYENGEVHHVIVLH